MSEAQPIFLASANPHKVAELQELADQAGVPISLGSARELGGMPAVEEDAGTFVGNARKKARALWNAAGSAAWVLADDSGICVDALGGAPGVESAYFAGPAGDDTANLQKLAAVMKTVPPSARGAHYVCVLFLIDGEGGEHVFAGHCHGTLVDTPVGKGGFGYDPIFIPAGYTETFGTLPATTKQALSHRARAWRQLCDWFRSVRTSAS